jgi:hypothetical protein
MEATILEIECENNVKESLYDLSPLNYLLERIISPGEYSKLLREVHHVYASLLLEDFIDSDLHQEGKEIQYTNRTIEDLYFLKVLADCFEEIEKANA